MNKLASTIASYYIFVHKFRLFPIKDSICLWRAVKTKQKDGYVKINYCQQWQIFLEMFELEMLVNKFRNNIISS